MKFVKRDVTIDAPREIVWRYLEDPNLLAAWLMRNDFKLEKGRPFRFFARPNDDWDGVIHCQLVDFERPGMLTFTWNANNIDAETLVTIELEENGKQTRVRLTHTNFEGTTGDVEAIVARHDAGWADHLRVLAVQAGEEASSSREAPTIDWTEFTLHVAIDADPKSVIGAWSTISGMESFFVEMMRITAPDGDERAPDEWARPGDRFVWRWHSGRRVEGEYLAPAESDEVRFSFGESNVSVCAQPWKGGTLLRLRQYDIPDTEEARMHVHTNCRGGWVYFLTVLKTLLEKGIDGRDTTRETGASFSTYFDPTDIGLEF